MNLLPGRKVSSPAKYVFHICIWPSADHAIAIKLLSVSKIRELLESGITPLIKYVFNASFYVFDKSKLFTEKNENPKNQDVN